MKDDADAVGDDESDSDAVIRCCWLGLDWIGLDAAADLHLWRIIFLGNLQAKSIQS